MQPQVLVTPQDLPRGNTTQQAVLLFNESNLDSEKEPVAGGLFCRANWGSHEYTSIASFFLMGHPQWKPFMVFLQTPTFWEFD